MPVGFQRRNLQEPRRTTKMERQRKTLTQFPLNREVQLSYWVYLPNPTKLPRKDSVEVESVDLQRRGSNLRQTNKKKITNIIEKKINTES